MDRGRAVLAGSRHTRDRGGDAEAQTRRVDDAEAQTRRVGGRHRRCRGCATPIAGAGARWCPACGARLPAVTGRGRRPRAGWLVAGLVGLAVTSVVASVAGGSGDGGRLGDRGEADRLAVDTAPVTSVAGERDPVCLPEGCVRWQLPLDGELVAAGHGLVLLLGDTRLRALDADTGVPLWVADLGDLVAHHQDGRPRRSLTEPLAPATVVPHGDGVLVVAPSSAAWLTSQGGRAWTHELQGYLARDGVVQGEHVVLRTRSPRGSGPFGRVSVLDRADGRERWGREVAAAHLDRAIPDPLPRHLGAAQVPDDAPVLVTGPGDRLEALEPADGSLRWAADLGDPPATVTRRGAVVRLSTSSGRRDLELTSGRPHRTGESFPPPGTAGSPDDAGLQVALTDGTVLRAAASPEAPRTLSRAGASVQLPDPDLRLLGTEPMVVGDDDRVAGIRLGAEG